MLDKRKNSERVIKVVLMIYSTEYLIYSKSRPSVKFTLKIWNSLTFYFPNQLRFVLEIVKYNAPKTAETFISL